MRKFCDHARYYWSIVVKNSHEFLFKLLSALTFLMMFYYFAYIVYYSVVTYELSKVIMGSISLCMMIHLNKSLH